MVRTRDYHLYQIDYVLEGWAEAGGMHGYRFLLHLGILQKSWELSVFLSFVPNDLIEIFTHCFIMVSLWIKFQGYQAF